MDKVKVFLSDPQVFFREGIHFILSGEEDFEVTGEATGNDEAFSLIEANPPNIAVLSMQDRKTNGPEITRRIKRSQPAVAVILMTEKKEDEKVFEAIKSGVSMCLIKDAEPEEFLDIVRVVSQGSLPILDELMTPGLAAMAAAEFEEVKAVSERMDNLLAKLTNKETQALEGFAAGSTIEQVAQKLGTSEDTVRHHIRQVLNKLVANDQAEAVIEAAQRGLPTIIRPLKKDGKLVEYVTKAEFTEFKDQLMDRLKSLLGGLS